MDKRTKRVLEQMSKVKEIERIYQKSNNKFLRISFLSYKAKTADRQI